MTHGRIRPLDGLRGVSIGLVLLSHAGLGSIVPGGLGVTIFFFISGYIITRLLLNEASSTGKTDVVAFYIRRAFRILPALLVYLLVATVYLAVHLGNLDPLHLTAAILNVYNYYYIFALDHSNPTNLHHPYAIVWSLAVEEHYYLVYPFLFAAFSRRPARLFGILIGACAVVLAWRCWLVWGVGMEHLRPERIYKATDTRIDSIAWGAMLALLQSGAGGRGGEKLLAGLRRWGLACGVLLLIFSLAHRDENFRQSVRYTVQGVALFAMYLPMIEAGSVVTRLLASRPMVWLGTISYSLYLWHWLVVYWLQHSPTAANWPPLLQNGLLVAGSLIVAGASQRLIETPFLQRGASLLAARKQGLRAVSAAAGGRAGD